MKINKKYLLLTITLFLIEVCIALFVRDKFIRPFIGDALVTMLLFSFVRIFYSGNSYKVALGVLLFSFSIEIFQYFNLIEILHLKNNKLAKIVLGSTFDWLDLLAYFVGVLLSFLWDKKLSTKNQP